MTTRTESRRPSRSVRFRVLLPDTGFVLYTILEVRSRPAGGHAPEGDRATTGGAAASAPASRLRSRMTVFVVRPTKNPGIAPFGPLRGRGPADVPHFSLLPPRGESLRPLPVG